MGVHWSQSRHIGFAERRFCRLWLSEGDFRCGCCFENGWLLDIVLHSDQFLPQLLHTMLVAFVDVFLLSGVELFGGRRWLFEFADIGRWGGLTPWCGREGGAFCRSTWLLLGRFGVGNWLRWCLLGGRLFGWLLLCWVRRRRIELWACCCRGVKFRWEAGRLEWWWKCWRAALARWL